VRNKTIVVIAVLVALVAIIVAIIAAKSYRDRAGMSGGHRTNGPARVLEESLSDHKTIWLLIHSTMCIPCKEMEQTARELEPEFKGKIVFVSAIVDDPKADAVLKKYKIELIPTSFFINSDGKVVKKVVGAIPKAELRRKLRELAEAGG